MAAAQTSLEGARQATAGRRILRSAALRVADALLWIGAACGALTLAAVAWFQVAGLRPLVVQSGSMEPTIPTGSLALVEPVPAAQLRTGDVVWAARPDGTRVLHRIVGIEPARRGVALTLKGDANRAADAETFVARGEARRVRLSVPGAGRLAALFRSPLAGFAVAVVVLAPLALGRRRRTSG